MMGRFIGLIGTLCITTPLLVLALLFTLLKEVIRRPRKFLQFPETPTPEPETLRDPKWGTSAYVEANGIKFHYVTKGNGGLMLCLHGWPEFWFSWRTQLEEFGRDYTVVALDLRGFNKTDKPRGREAYMLPVIMRDIEQIIQRLGHDKCTLVGHDWGAHLAWLFAHYKPAMVEALVVMSVPYTNAMGAYDIMTLAHFPLFNVPIVPELLLSAGNYYLIRAILLGDTEGEQFSREDRDAYVHSISQAGALTASLSYYRYVGSPRPEPKLEDRKVPYDIEPPVLLLQGEKDRLFSREAFERSKTFCRSCELIFIPKANHWLQQQQPDLVNQAMRNFLRKLE